VDRWAFNVVDGLRSGALTDVAKLITDLGSTPAMLAVALLGSAAFAVRGRWAAAVVLVVGLIMTTIAVDLIKAAVDRPRPANSLVDTVHSSYPSGHAAHAVVYSYLAFAAAFGGRVPLAKRTAVIVGGIVAVSTIAATSDTASVGAAVVSAVEVGGGSSLLPPPKIRQFPAMMITSISTATPPQRGQRRLWGAWPKYSGGSCLRARACRRSSSRSSGVSRRPEPGSGGISSGSRSGSASPDRLDGSGSEIKSSSPRRLKSQGSRDPPSLIKGILDKCDRGAYEVPHCAPP